MSHFDDDDEDPFAGQPASDPPPPLEGFLASVEQEEPPSANEDTPVAVVPPTWVPHEDGRLFRVTFEPNWWRLTPEAADTQMQVLWNFWLYAAKWWELEPKIRPCWPQHGFAIDEMSAIFQLWLETYQVATGAETKGGGTGGEFRFTTGLDMVRFREHLASAVVRLQILFEEHGCGQNHMPRDLPEHWKTPEGEPITLWTTRAPTADGPQPF